jgi:putative FmdB family regulatory protein
MPIYVYGCECCDHTFERSMKISERHLPCEEVCSECGGAKYNIRPTAVRTVASVMTNLKPPEGFKEVLKKIKSKNRGSTIDV